MPLIDIQHHNIHVPNLFDARFVDGAAVVHALPVHEAATFGELVEKVFMAWVRRSLRNCQRLDIVWDT